MIRFQRAPAAVLWVIAVASAATAQMPSFNPRTDIGTPDRPVSAGTVVGSTVYLGGQFRQIGTLTGPFAIVDSVTATPIEGLPQVEDGEVFAITADGQGGWFIAGTFTVVAGKPRHGVAQIAPDGSLLPWTSAIGGGFRAVAVAGGRVFLGGSGLYAVSSTTGLPTGPNFAVAGFVNAITVSGSRVYVGGSFTSILGTARSSLASLDIGTNQLLAWHQHVQGSVSAILADGASVVIGGSFSQVGGEPRLNLAWLAEDGGAVDPLSIPTDAEVFALASSGTRLFVGGRFGSVGTMPRRGLAALDLATSTVLPWNPDLGSVPGSTEPPTVNAIAIAGGEVLVGGSFYRIQAEVRRGLCSVDAVSGQLRDWNPLPSCENEPRIYALSSTGPETLVGGQFRIMGGESRNGCAAIDLNTGELLPWQAQVPGASAGRIRIAGMATDGTRVFISGASSPNAGGGGESEFLAAVDAQTGLSAPEFLAFSQAACRPLVVAGAFLCVPCDVGGASAICALDRVTGDLVWSSGTTGGLKALAVDPAGLRMSSAETNGSVRGLWASNGSPVGWTVSADDEISCLTWASNRLYLAGSFGTIGPNPRHSLAALDFPSPNSPQLSPWAPEVDGTVTALSVHASAVFLSGGFTTIGGESRPYLGAVGTSAPYTCVWAPTVQGAASVILSTPTRVIVLGPRARAGSRMVEGVLVFEIDCIADFNGDCLLNVNDFIAFQNAFAAGNPSANCDGSAISPILNVNDFACFCNRFASGCR